MTDDDKLSFLDGTSEPEATEPQVAEPAEKPRDDQGRFAKAQETGESVEAPAEPEEPPAVAPPAAEVQEKPQHTIPVSVLVEERKAWQERMDRAEEKSARELAELRREFQQGRHQPTPPAPVEIPDPVENPQEYAIFMAQRQAVALDQQEARISEYMARDKFGTEAVDAALAAAQQAGVVGHFTRGIDRWSRLVEWHKQQVTVAEIGDDPVAYREKLRAEVEAELRAELRAEIAAQTPPPAPARPSAPPPSMASAPGAASRLPVSKGSAFDKAIPA